MTDTPTNSTLARRLLVAAALVVSFLLVALELGIAHYGPTSDELYYHDASRRHIAWLAKLGKPGWLSDETLKEHFAWAPETVVHPTFSRWCSGLTWLVFHRAFGLDELVSLRLHNAIAFALMAWGIVGFVWPRYGAIAATVGLFLLWSDVRLFGHTHSGQTDLMLACVWLWAVLLAVRGIHEGSRPALVGAAVVAGLALATKLTGVLLVGLLVAWPVWVHGRRGLWMSAAFVVVPAVVFYALNPQCWLHPVEWTQQWLSDFRARERFTNIPSLFFGERYTFRAPWYAPTVYALITIPPAILLLAAIAAADAVRRLWNADLAALWQELRSPWMLCTAAGAAPLVACSLPGAPNHDLERLFLPTQPLLILAAAYGFWVLAQGRWLARAFARWPRAPQWLAAAALATILLVPTVASAIQMHPYELTYFNFLVGGPRGAEKLGFDVAYLKQEFNEQAIDAVNQFVPPNGRLIGNFLHWELLMHQQAGRLRKDIHIVTQYDEADCIVIHGRRSCMHALDEQLFDQPERAIWRLEPRGVVLVALFPMDVASVEP